MTNIDRSKHPRDVVNATFDIIYMPPCYGMYKAPRVQYLLRSWLAHG